MHRLLLAVLLYASSLGVVAAQETPRVIVVNSPAVEMRLSPDNRTLVAFENWVVLNDNTLSASPIRLIDLESGDTIARLSGHTDFVTDAVFSPDGAILYTMHRNGDLNLWDIEARAPIERRQTSLLGGGQMQITADGSTFVNGTGAAVGQFFFTDVATGFVTQVLQRRFTRFSEFIDNYSQFPARGDVNFSAFAISPDGTLLASATQNDAVELWETATGEVIATLREPSEQFGQFNIRQMQFTTDGRLVYFDNGDGQTHFWDTATQEEIMTVEAGGFPFALSPDGTRLAWADRQTSGVLLLDLNEQEDAQQLAQVDALGTIAPGVTRLAFTSDGARLVVGGLVDTNGASAILVFDLR